MSPCVYWQLAEPADRGATKMTAYFLRLDGFLY